MTVALCEIVRDGYPKGEGEGTGVQPTLQPDMRLHTTPSPCAPRYTTMSYNS